MFSVKMTGFDKVLRELEEVQHACSALDGTIATLRFDPEDSSSVQRAINDMESAVDDKVAPFRGNELVSSIGESMKETYRKAILERAREAK